LLFLFFISVVYFNCFFCFGSAFPKADLEAIVGDDGINFRNEKVSSRNIWRA
jgi:hypothetical protein